MRSDYLAHERQYRLRRERGFPGWGTREEAAEMLALLEDALPADLPAGSRVLELGCGAGQNCLRLAERGFRVTGVDIAPTAVSWARENAAARSLAADFRVGDVVTLEGLPDQAFDLVLDGCCLHCIVGEDRAATLRSARRVLKPGGYLLVITMCGAPVTEALRRNFDPATGYQMHGDVAIRYCGPADAIRREVRAAGFAECRARVVRHPEGAGEDMLVLLAARTAFAATP